MQQQHRVSMTSLEATIAPSVRAWRFGVPLLVLAAAIGVVLVLLQGVRSNLPAVYDIDEIQFVTLVTAMIHHHTPNPHWFGHPGTTLLYLMAMVWGGMYVVGHALGIYASPQAFQSAYFHDLTPFYEASRLIVVAAAVACLALTYLVARRVTEPVFAALAAVLLACSPLFLTYSVLIRSDVLMTALVLATVLASLSVMKTSSGRSSLAAGALAALAFDTKYPAILVFATLLLAHWWSDKRSRVRRFAGCVGAFAVTSFLASPFMYLDFRQVLKDLVVERRTSELGGVGEGFARNLLWYVHDALGYGLGTVVLLAAAIGIVIALRGQRNARVLLPYPLLTLLFISALSLRWDRWVVTLLPWAAIFAALGIRAIVRAVPERAHARAVVAALLLVTAFAPLLVGSERIVAGWNAVDPRVVGAQWMDSHLQTGSSVFLEPLAAELDRTRFRFYAASRNGQLHPVDERANLHSTYIPVFGTLAQLSTPESLARERVRYVVVDAAVLRQYDAAPVYAEMARRERRAIAAMTLVHTWQNPAAGQVSIALYRVRQ